jgi:osmotically-inducible protein OsmY
VTVSSGMVTLEGTVPERWMRHAIENEADRCSGVRDIENKIRVQSSDQESQSSTTTGTTGTGTTTTGSGSSTSTSRSKLS